MARLLDKETRPTSCTVLVARLSDERNDAVADACAGAAWSGVFIYRHYHLTGHRNKRLI
jgi:hypothetical protein